MASSLPSDTLPSAFSQQPHCSLPGLQVQFSGSSELPLCNGWCCSLRFCPLFLPLMVPSQAHAIALLHHARLSITLTWVASLHHDFQHHLLIQLRVPLPVASQTWASLRCHNKSKRELLSPKLATSAFPQPLGCSSHWASLSASGTHLPDDPACCLRQAPPLRDLGQSLSPHHTPGSLDLSPEWMHILHQGLLPR